MVSKVLYHFLFFLKIFITRKLATWGISGGGISVGSTKEEEEPSAGDSSECSFFIQFPERKVGEKKYEQERGGGRDHMSEPELSTHKIYNT